MNRTRTSVELQLAPRCRACAGSTYHAPHFRLPASRGAVFPAGSNRFYFAAAYRAVRPQFPASRSLLIVRAHLRRVTLPLAIRGAGDDAPISQEADGANRAPLHPQTASCFLSGSKFGRHVDGRTFRQLEPVGGRAVALNYGRAAGKPESVVNGKANGHLVTITK